MSRSLTLTLLLTTVLAGCAVFPPAQVTVHPNPQIADYSALQQWLDMREEVAAISPEQASETLTGMEESADSSELFYFGLLKQQLQIYDGWTKARDIFRQLREARDLTDEQQQLAGILEDYNQNRINWYHRQSELLIEHAKLQQQLLDSEQEKLLLEQKIQALTDLEEAMSSRKEQ